MVLLQMMMKSFQNETVLEKFVCTFEDILNTRYIGRFKNLMIGSAVGKIWKNCNAAFREMFYGKRKENFPKGF